MLLIEREEPGVSATRDAFADSPVTLPSVLPIALRHSNTSLPKLPKLPKLPTLPKLPEPRLLFFPTGSSPPRESMPLCTIFQLDHSPSDKASRRKGRPLSTPSSYRAVVRSIILPD